MTEEEFEIDFTDPFSSQKVGLVYSEFSVQGGAETVTAELADHLNCPIYTMHYNPQQFDDEMRNILDQHVREIYPESLYGEDEESHGFAVEITDYSSVATLNGGYKDANVDAINADVLIACDFAGALIAYRTGIPYLTYLHNTAKAHSDYFWDHFDNTDGIRAKLGFLAEKIRVMRDSRRAAKASEIVMSNSERVRQRTIKEWKVSADDIKVIHPPIDTEFYTLPTEDYESPLDIDNYFLAPQRLDPYKNVHTLVEGAKLTNEHLVITGSGRLEDYFRREAQYNDNIHTLGFVDKETLRKLFWDAKATMQSTFREDFGMVPVESMATGTPVVLPNSGGYRETVGTGYDMADGDVKTDWGILLDVDNYGPEKVAGAMTEFNPHEFDQHDIRERAEEFSTERFVDEVTAELEKVYEEYN